MGRIRVLNLILSPIGVATQSFFVAFIDRKEPNRFEYYVSLFAYFFLICYFSCPKYRNDHSNFELKKRLWISIYGSMIYSGTHFLIGLIFCITDPNSNDWIDLWFIKLLNAIYFLFYLKYSAGKTEMCRIDDNFIFCYSFAIYFLGSSYVPGISRTCKSFLMTFLLSSTDWWYARKRLFIPPNGFVIGRYVETELSTICLIVPGDHDHFKRVNIV